MVIDLFGLSGLKCGTLPAVISGCVSAWPNATEQPRRGAMLVDVWEAEPVRYLPV
jgi:hypothetical protein